MMTFSFQAEARPFPRWLGPFSPARGTNSGFRFHGGRLGTWVENLHGREFWPIEDSRDIRVLSQIVLECWGGGRVLLLPNGLVIKPLQGDYEVGQRALIGRFRGGIVLERPGDRAFDLDSPDTLTPGEPWAGPKTTGLECAVQPDGSLECNWYHPAPWGREEVRERLHSPDRLLATGFQRARPGDAGGRVRVTARGHVITNRQDRDGTWVSMYVGRIATEPWPHRQEWIRRERT